MFEPADLDPREQEIFANADSWYATRFVGRGVYDRIGPFETQLDALNQITAFFRNEERNYPPPDTIWNRPFALYAASSKHQNTHVVVGCVYRDGVKRQTYHEFQQRRDEERKLARRSRSRRDPAGTGKV